LAIASRVAEGSELELVDVELKRQRRGALVRVYLDRPGGVGLDALQQASREISAVLDAEDAVEGPYTLEVSSPGLDRPLVKEADFRRAVGRRVRVTLSEGSEEAHGRRLVGRLASAEAGRLRLELAGGEVADLAIEQVERAKIEVEFA